MKPWLFDILACPIDKHFPLKLFIFTYETKQEEFESFLNVYQKRDIDQIKQRRPEHQHQGNCQTKSARYGNCMDIVPTALKQAFIWPPVSCSIV